VHLRATQGVIETHLNAGQLEALLGNSAAAATDLQKASEFANEALARGSEIPPETQVNVYFRQADARYHKGDANGELSYYRKSLEVSEKWASGVGSSEALAILRDCYQQVGNALARTGDLYGARDSLQKAEEAANRLSSMANIVLEQRYNSIGLHNSFGDILAAPDDPNFGDPSGAIRRYQQALELAEGLAAGDPKNLNARRNLAICYRRIGMLLARQNPGEAVGYYEKALPIAEDLDSSDPSNIEYRYALARTYMGVGEALHALNKNEDAIGRLRRAVELQKSIEARSPERIWHLRILSRTHVLLGDALLDHGDTDEALSVLQEGLAAADRLLQRAPTSLYYQLDRADAVEAMGTYYLTRSQQAGLADDRREQLRGEARSWFDKGLAIWQDWTSRNVGAPYAARRLSQAKAYITATRLERS
jgi:tetratricopeptide (TPR) repeat protein